MSTHLRNWSHNRFVPAVLAGFFFALAASQAAAFDIAASTSSHPGLSRQWAPGDSVTLNISSSPAPSGSFQWYHDDTAIVGATAATLTLTALSTADNGNYRLRVASGTTQEFSANTLTINVLPFAQGAVDSEFTFAPANPSQISSVGPFAVDGSMMVNNGPEGMHGQIGRIDRTGKEIAGFSFPASAGRVLATFPDGGLLVSKSPYRLDSLGNAIGFSLPSTFDPNQPLSAGAVQSDGKFYLAQGGRLVRFLADGNVDPSFTFADSAETGISSLQFDRAERLYVNGRRTNPDPRNFPSSWSTFYRVLANGTRDPGFSNQVSEPILNGYLQVTPLDDGRILYYAAYHGYRVWKILRDDGTVDTAWSGQTEFTERVPVVNPATGQVYLVNASGKLLRYQVTASELTQDLDFYPGTSSFLYSSITLDPDGEIMVVGYFTQWEGHPTYQIVRLHDDAVAGTIPPNAEIRPSSDTPVRGSTVTFSTFMNGTGPFTYQWLALDGQPLPATTRSEQLVIANFGAEHLGRYQLRATGPNGVRVLSNVVRLSLGRQASYLTNLSGRAMTGTGEDTVIAGLSVKITAGALGLSTLLRGAGPALQPLGVTNYLRNPALDLYSGNGQLLSNNDQWSTTPDAAVAFTAAGAFSFATGSNDAALLHSFGTGNFTLMLKSQDATPGVGLLEIYQLFPSGYEYLYQSLLNLSLRARTGPGDATAIAGFVIADPQNFDRPARVLLRAVGPTLATSGIVHPLENPVLTLYNSKGEVVAQNDDWAIANTSGDAAALSAAMKQVGAFDLSSNSKDAALLLDLPAGAYSMHATGGSGVVLMEIYLLR